MHLLLFAMQIVYYRNGEFVGTAFQDIYAGAYFPTLSVYKSATVSANFGPNFKYQPTGWENWTAVSVIFLFIFASETGKMVAFFCIVGFALLSSLLACVIIIVVVKT